MFFNTTTKKILICSSFCFVAVICLLSGGKTCLAADESVQYYKMLTTLEYSGKTQFRNQAELFFTVKKQFLSDDKTLYFLTAKDISSTKLESPLNMSFFIDSKTHYLSADNGDLAFIEKLTNYCVDEIKSVAKNSVEKSWQQSFNLSPIDKSFSSSLGFGLNATKFKTQNFGEVIAVRAISKPFTIATSDGKNGMGDVQGTLNALYLFDPKIENVYMSIAVFEATTKVNGSKEVLRYELATYQTDADGTSINLTGLGKEFESYARKVGLTTEAVKMEKLSVLPQWVRSDGFRVIQASNICAAIACEGALNPVATLYIPAARTITMQGASTLGATGNTATVSGLLAKNLTGVGAMKIAVVPAFAAGGISGATLIGGGAAAAGGAVAVGGGGGGGGSAASP
jgi:hypothetical protein